MIGVISFTSGVFIGCVIMYILVTRGAVYGDYNITFKEKTDDGNQEGMYNIGISFRAKDAVPRSRKIILYRQDSHR